MIVAVGSKNRTKVKAVEEAFRAYFRDATIVSVEVDPGVPPQPLGEEIFVGAKNRALRALECCPEAYFGVGIESGLVEFGEWTLSKSVVFIAGRGGEVGFSVSAQFPLPLEIVERVKRGEEMGSVVDEIFGVSNARTTVGAVGLLTKNVIDRVELYKHAVVLALIPIVNRGFRWTKGRT